MTSILFTRSSGGEVSLAVAELIGCFRSGSTVWLSFAIPPPQVLLLRISCGRFFDHRTDDAVVGFDPIRDEHPLTAVPLMDACMAGALMVAARHFQGLQHAHHP